MAVEHVEGKAPRPMPSVDIPLLREERRATQARQAVRLAVALAVVAVAATAIALAARYLPITGVGRGSLVRSIAVAYAPAGPLPLAPLPVPPPESRAPDPVRVGGVALDAGAGTTGGRDAGGLGARTTRAFGAGRGFRDALRRAGASAGEASDIVAALDRVMDFRRCRPDDELVFVRNEQGALVEFEYHASITEQYRAAYDRGRGRMRGERLPVPVSLTRIAKGGAIRTSLGDALDSAGLGRTLVGAFVEALEGRVSFSTDARVGDTFRVVVDEERVGGSFLRYGVAHALEYNGQRTGIVRAFFFEERRGEGDYFDASGRAMHGGWLRTPVRYDHISSGFTLRRMHPVLHRMMPHTGIDYVAPPGTPVWAAASGTVTFAGDRGPNGNLVTVRHDGGFETSYAHLSRMQRGLSPGVRVRQRAAIGAVGSTGRSTGPHLHFALKRGGRFVDPARELNGPGRMLPRGALDSFRRQVRRLQAELDRIRIPSLPRATTAAAPAVPASSDEPLD